MSGGYEAYGAGSLEGIQFALEEANASGRTPQIELKLYDNASNAERAHENSRQIVASNALLVIGPSNSVTALAAGPEFARGGIAAIGTTATSDQITDNSTTFRMLMKNSDQGELLAIYLQRALGQRRAAVIVMDDSFGRTIEAGFRRTADQLGIDATYHVLKNGENSEERMKVLEVEIAHRP